MRADELDLAAVRARQVAVPSVQELQVAAVRIHRIEIDSVHSARVVPAAEKNLAAVEHDRIEVVALIERHLMHVAAVGVHHVHHVSGLFPVLVLGIELRLALVEQDRLRLPLASRGIDDAAVGQVIRRHVLTRSRRDVGGDQPVKRVGSDLVFPDGPGRLVVHVLGRVEGPAHREQHLLAVLRDLHTHHVTGALGLTNGDVPLHGGRRRAIAHVQIGTDVEAARVAQIGALLHLVVLVEQRALGIRDREIRRDRIRALTGADADAAVAGAAATGKHDAQQGQRQATALKHIYDSIAPCAHRKSLSR